MNGRKWSLQETKALIRDYEAGVSMEILCVVYDRSERAIHNKVHSFGVGRIARRKKKKQIFKQPVEVFRWPITPWPDDVHFEDAPGADRVGRRVFI